MATLDIAGKKPNAVSEAPSAIPTVRHFGNYELLEEIARGGMGVVYKARQVSLDRLVAVKMILAGEFATPQFVQRFHTEASAAAVLHHPNIVAIHEVGVHAGQHFFSMDFVDGPSLAQGISDLRFRISDFKQSARWMKIIAEAIHYAHEQGILHRDLKPSNVLIDAHDQPRITDFGLAKRLPGKSEITNQKPEMDLTVSGQVLGSPNFMPPEQASGKHGKVGRYSDVYALGGILYHLLTARPPFQADSIEVIVSQVLTAEPVSPRLLNPTVPRDLETICLKCLEKEPSRRYATAQALADELGRFLRGEPILARPVSRPEKVWRWCRRKPALATALGAVVLVATVGFGGILTQWQRAERERDLALRQAYASDMNLAQRSLEEGSLGHALELLNKYRPAQAGKSEIDLRGWEWRYLWGLCRSDEQFTVLQRSNALTGVAFSPDGKLLAVRQTGGNIELWDWVRREPTGTLTNQSWPLAMAFAPKESLLASANRAASGHPVVSLWDITTRQIVRDLPQPSAVNSLAFSPDGKVLATFHMDPMVRLWQIPSGAPITNFPGSQTVNPDTRLPLFSPDGATLALGEMRSTIRLLKWQTGEELLLRIPSEANGVSALAFSADGRLLAAGYAYGDGAIRLWDTATGAPAGQLEGHKGWVSRLIFAPDDQTLFSASADQTIGVWSIAEKRELRRLQGHTGRVTGLALAPDGRRLVSCADDGSVRAWNQHGQRSSGQPTHVVLPMQVAPFGAPFTSDSRRLITASRTALVTIWDVATATERERIPALGTNNQSVALSPDEQMLAVGGSDGSIKVWDVNGRRLMKQFQAHDSIPIWKLRFLDRGKTLLSGAMLPLQRIEIRRWDVATWQQHPFELIDVDWAVDLVQSPDQRHLAVAYDLAQQSPEFPFLTAAHAPGALKLWDYTAGRLEAALAPTTVRSFMSVFSPDGRLLASQVDGVVRVWEVASRREVAVLRSHANAATSVGFSPDGRRVVTGSYVGGSLGEVARVWDFVVQRDLIRLRGRGTWTGWTAFSPDGNTVLAVSWAGVAELWRAPAWKEIGAAEKGHLDETGSRDR
jgi:WD40 repeat protein